MTTGSTPADDRAPGGVVPLLALRNTVLFPGTTLPLTVGRPASVRALDQAARSDSRVVVVAQRATDVDEPTRADLFEVGTLAEILRMVNGPGDQRVAIVRGVERVRIQEMVATPLPGVRVERIAETQPASTEIEARVLHLRQTALQAVGLLPQEMPELVAAIEELEDPARLSDLVASALGGGVAEKQQLLETSDVAARLRMVEERAAHQVEVMSLTRKIADEAHQSIDQVQREFFLRKQLEAIRRELGEDEPRAAEFAAMRKKLEAAAPPEEVLKQARAELDALERMPEGSAETTVVRNHLEWIAALPWKRRSEERIDLAEARKVLDQEHCGLEKVKRRILELLAVRKLKPGGKSPILCFVGPPGVGKTSLGRAIARATHREFVRQSLGGVHDEAEIRGHRRTYVGALPGRILQGIRKAGTANPVFMLDEVDKLSSSLHGDPAAALLEVLDPEQNAAFEDHYLGCPFDLSGVLFIATANLLDPLPPALRDRMEVIELAGYSEQEKIEIAARHLLPRLLDATGLTPQDLRFDESAVREVIRGHTREAGVRQLERELGTICRRVAVRFAEGDRAPVAIDAAAVAAHLGAPRFREEVALRTSLAGVATGLAWTLAGGDILFVEATRMAGAGRLTLTGQLGEVMKESAQAAWSLVKSRADALGIEPALLRRSDVHVHLPAGAIPKDGPSAGITLFVALASLFTGRRVRRDVAMTGEISLRGLVLPVGGIREKVLAARRAGIPRLLLPELNRRDFDELPEEVRREVEVGWLDRVETALELALEAEEVADTPPQDGAGRRAAPELKRARAS